MRRARHGPAKDVLLSPVSSDELHSRHALTDPALRGIVGAIMVLVAQAAQAAGIELDAGVLTELACQIISIAGAVLAAYGRIRAQQPIGR